MKKIAIDFSKSAGPVKPVHSVGQGPVLPGFKMPDFSMFRHLKEAGVPYARLHDVGGWFGGNLYVDIPNLFRDFDADENDPASYDFAFTDIYLAALVENGVEPYYRLGVTIENFAETIGKAYRIHPPKDFKKWARICEHVIRHYTEGWAGGFKYKITYWEIWNEPDDFIDERNQMWRGTWRQFCELYEVASKHLKAKFPHLKFGGYGKCTSYYANNLVDGETPTEEEMYRHRCFEEFCAFVAKRKCPLDFFSFHGYFKPRYVASNARYHRKLLRDAGLGGVELHLNEWLCGDRSGYFWRRASLASAIAAFVASCQLAKDLAIANIYDARCDARSSYAPLFDGIARQPGKAFYAFKYFNVLYRLGHAVKCEVDGGQGSDGLWCVAATGRRPSACHPAPSLLSCACCPSPGSKRATASMAPLLSYACCPSPGNKRTTASMAPVLSYACCPSPGDKRTTSGRAAAFIVNDSPKPCRLDADFGGLTPVSCRIVDSSRTDVEIPLPDALPPHSLLLAQFA